MKRRWWLLRLDRLSLRYTYCLLNGHKYRGFPWCQVCGKWRR